MITLYPQKSERGSAILDSEAGRAYILWRGAAADALEAADLLREAAAFRACGHYFDVDVCVVDLDHAPRAVPHTCHLRYCPECERREQFRKLARFIPVIQDLITLGKPGYSLKHIILTTPYHLGDKSAPKLFKAAWSALERVLDRVFYKVLDNRSELSSKEKRRGEVNFKVHGIGILAAAEFGEDTHHLHFHLLAYCPYIPIKFLVDTWQAVTQGECEVAYMNKVDLQKVEKAVLEVSKYVTKFGALPPELVPALARVLDGTKRLRTYGAMRGIGKTERQPCSCPICSADRRLLHLMDYIESCLRNGKRPDDSIVDKAESAALLFFT